VFVRLLPMISIFEVRMLVHEQAGDAARKQETH
jgi:hypothetical protein